MEKIILLLSSIEVNPVRVETFGDNQRFSAGNDYRIMATRIIQDGNLSIDITVNIDDPGKKIKNPVDFIKHLTIGFKEPKSTNKIIKG